MTDRRKNRPDDIGPDDEVLIREKPETKTPAMYKVLLLNDDFTPMEFVVDVLRQFFRLTGDEATRVMLTVHNHGVGLCGVFTFEVAETKAAQVNCYARLHQHPLQCAIEEA
jgi:ATP-dependent Clp protease adaptor protein ClpS